MKQFEQIRESAAKIADGFIGCEQVSEKIRAMPLPEPNGDKERQVFEKWVSDQGVAMDYRGDGIYGNPTVRRWREGFNAALELVCFPRDTESLRAENEKLNEEILSLHRKLAEQTLNAEQGWQRYEAANKLRQETEDQLMALKGGAE